jgi:hypothetical protein
VRRWPTARRADGYIRWKPTCSSRRSRPQPRSPLMSMKTATASRHPVLSHGLCGSRADAWSRGLPLAPQPEGLLLCRFPAGPGRPGGRLGGVQRGDLVGSVVESADHRAAGRLGWARGVPTAAVPFGRAFWSPIGCHAHPLGDRCRRGGRSVQAVRTMVGDERWPGAAGATARLPGRLGDARQPLVQGRSFSGFRTAQMCLIRLPATSKAITVTVTPSC